MVTFLIHIILTSLCIWGVHGFFQLTGLSDGLDWLPLWVSKPLFDCPPCQSSVYGTFSFFIVGNYNSDFTVSLWVSFCFILCGLNYIIKEFLYA